MNKKEAIEIIKKNWPDSRYTMLQEALQTLIPELKESEDEKIIRTLKEIVNWGGAKNISVENNVELKDCLTWLEKQGEKTEPIEGFNTEFEKQISHLIASTINKEHEYNEGFVKWAANALLNYAKHELEKQGEQKSAEWTYHDEVHRDAAIRYLESIKSPHDTAYQMKEEVIDWLKSLKPKENLYDKGYNDGYSAAKYNHWKPSEEQMQALEYAMAYVSKKEDFSVHETIELLYNDLKNL